MERGLIHLYCGDGKGKTTAAMGLAVRALGTGKRVVLAQFFKDGTSSEMEVLRGLPGVCICCEPRNLGFYYRMNEETRAEAREAYSRVLRDALAAAADADLLVLDEVVSACGLGVADAHVLESFLHTKPVHLEVVMTGRDPAPFMVEAADYVSEVVKIKHPYDRGIKARKGIEL